MNISVKVSNKTISHLVQNGLMNGISYWAGHYSGSLPVIIEDEDGEKFELTEKKVAKGLRILAKKYPETFADILTDSYDVFTGDAIIQCALFGEIIYR